MEPRIFSLKEIEAVVKGRELEVVDSIAEGFASYSSKKVYVAPVIHLGGEPALKGGGDVCIKTGFVKSDEYYVVKIAPGSFKGNEQLGLPTNTGLMMVFSQATGRLEGLLLDEGILTEIRTAAAGFLALRTVGNPGVVDCIGIIGTGVQARYQLRFLSPLKCRDVLVWGRTRSKVELFQKEMVAEGWRVQIAETTKEIGAKCNLIVSVTNAREPLISAADIRPGTHITCVGADGIGKQEIDPWIMKDARVFVDSKEQCIAFGEVSHAIKKGILLEEDVTEIGSVLSGSVKFTRDARDITVFDTTGVAVQDIQISKMVYNTLLEGAKIRASEREYKSSL